MMSEHATQHQEYDKLVDIFIQIKLIFIDY